MANLLFGFPVSSDDNDIYTTAFSGPAWVASGDVAIANLKTRESQHVARSVDATTANTKFRIDLGRAVAVSALGLFYHNLTLAATVRWRGYSDAGFSVLVYDSTAFLAWPAGQYTAESAAEIENGVTFCPTTAQSARYWLCEIVDTANPDGYVELGRLMICAGLQPTLNMDYGAKLGITTDTVRTVTDGGSAIYNEKPTGRTIEFTVSDLPEDEALSGFFDFQRRVGESGQFLMIYDPADTYNMPRRSFPAVLQQLSPLTASSYKRGTLSFLAKEEL